MAAADVNTWVWLYSSPTEGLEVPVLLDLQSADDLECNGFGIVGIGESELDYYKFLHLAGHGCQQLGDNSGFEITSERWSFARLYDVWLARPRIGGLRWVVQIPSLVATTSYSVFVPSRTYYKPDFTPTRRQATDLYPDTVIWRTIWIDGCVSLLRSCQAHTSSFAGT